MTTLPLDNLIAAAKARHSVRTFSPESVSEDAVSQIEIFTRQLAVPFAHERTLQYFKAQPGKKLYNNGVNPPDNFALMSQTDLVSISKTGFIGELVMLYIVSLGLGTCWFGHYKLAEVGRYVDGIAAPERIRESTLGYGYGNHVDVGERVICCMPFGRADENSKRLIDRIMRKKGANRKPLSELMENPAALTGMPEAVCEALDLAALAPSAGNSQMWRFGYDAATKTVTVAKPVGYKHFKWEHSDVDIGICAAHIWLGLQKRGHAPRVTVRQEQDRALWEFELRPH